MILFGRAMRGMGIAACAISLSAAVVARTTPRPWFGTWKLRIAPGERPETLIYSDAGNGAMRMVSVEQDSVIVTQFDGGPAADSGPNSDHQPLLAIRAVSPTRYSWTLFRSGRPYVRGVNTLAADRRTFTEVSWRVTDPGKTVMLIYERQ